MTEEYVPLDRQDDNFYQRFMEQRARDLNNPSTTDKNDSFPFPIKPLPSALSKYHRKRLDTHGSDSGFSSPIALSRSMVLSPAAPIETSTPHPPTSQQAQISQPSPKGQFSPIQQFISNSAKLRPKEPKNNRFNRISPILNQYWEPALDRTINFDPLYTIVTYFVNFIFHATTNPSSSLPLPSCCHCLISDFIEHDSLMVTILQDRTIIQTLQLNFCSPILHIIHFS